MTIDYPEMPSSEQEWRAHWAFYRLTVAQRDAAWREIDRQRAAVDVIRVNVLRALSEWAQGGDHDAIAREATSSITESFSSGASSAPEPEVLGYVVLRPDGGGETSIGYFVHPTVETAARAAEAITDAHVGVVTALPAEAES